MYDDDDGFYCYECEKKYSIDESDAYSDSDFCSLECEIKHDKELAEYLKENMKEGV